MEALVIAAAGLGLLGGVLVTWLPRRRARLSTATINAIILRRLQLALDAADAGAWEWRLGLPSLRASGFARLLGAPDDAAVEVRTWEEAVHPADRDRWRRTFDEAIATGSPWSCLHRVVDEQGVTRWLDARAEPIRGHDGVVDGMLGVCVDVTERQRRQERARRAAHVAQAVSETGAALTVLADESLIWAEAQESAQRIFGCDAVHVVHGDTPMSATPLLIDPASGIRVCSSIDGIPGSTLLVVPIDLAGAHEAQVILTWIDEQETPDAAWLAALDRFGANIALALVIARRQQAAAQRDVLVHRLQAGLMPTAGVGDGPLRVETLYQPGEDRLMLGGDFLDVIRHDDGRVSFILGDVCGHGPAEAALGTILRSAWMGIASAGAHDPADWLVVLDGILIARRDEPHTFVTAVTGTCDPRTGRLHYAVAGHPPPLLVHADADIDLRVTVLDEGAGPALGLRSRMRATTAQAAFPAGAAMLSVTDGLFEGLSATGERLGYSDFVDLIGRFPLAPGEHALRRLVTTVVAINGGPLDDDAAALLISHHD